MNKSIFCPLERASSLSMRSMLLICSCAIMLSCSQKDETQIFLCIGQSNMAGRADIQPEDTNSLENVYVFNSEGEWEKAKNPLNQYSTIRKNMNMQRLSPAWSFSQKLAKEYPNNKIGLVVNAKGGSSIDEWKKGSEFYNESLIRALQAQKTGSIKAIIWHQGESDQGKWQEYAGKFDSLAFHFRRDLGIPDLKIIVGEIGKWRDSSVQINEVLRSLPNRLSNVQTASAEGLTDKGDNSHFDSRSQRILGERYADRYIKMSQNLY
jgi:hypothetical protein